MKAEEGKSLGKWAGLAKNKKKILWLVGLLICLFVLVIGGFFALRTGYILKKISTKGGAWESLYHALPFVDNTIQGEQLGRINILMLGMRGADDPAGGLLSDTQMIVSLDLKDKKIALVSVPRDLLVDNPTSQTKTKLNAVYASAEAQGAGQGIAVAENKFSEIAGVPINYTVVANWQAFKDVIDSLGGVDVHLDTDFSETQQFMGVPRICNKTSYTVETGKYVKQHIKVKKDGVVKNVKTRRAQLCYPTNPPECGGKFTLASGDVNLSGEQALCFVRSRDDTNDFERAKRQQLILKQLKLKLLKVGTLTNFAKLNSLLSSLGNNVQTDLKPWELKRLYSIYMSLDTQNDAQILQHTLEDSDEGLLYWPGNIDGIGYVLLPRGDNYQKIQQLFENIFFLPSQSNANAKI